MKKQFALLALAVCLSLSGCVEKDVTEYSDTVSTEPQVLEDMPACNAQNKYLLVNALSFQETEDYFCGSNFYGNHLYYYDKISGISGLLCADPACTHDSSACGAYVQSGSTMFLYNGQRYWITNDFQTDGANYYLWRGDLVGTNQEKVKEISFEDVILPCQPQQYAIHRGNLYFLGAAQVVEGTAEGRRITLMSSPLDSTKEFTALFDQTYDKWANAQMRFVGNDVFFAVYVFPSGGPYDLTILKIDSKTGVTETVYEETGNTEGYRDFWVTEQEEIYLSSGPSLWKIAEGKRVEVATFENPDAFPNVLDGIAVSTYLKDGNRWMEIKNFSGETIYNGIFFPTAIPELEGDPNDALQPYHYTIVGGDTDKLILTVFETGQQGIHSYMLMLDLHDNLKPTVLWSSQE